MGSEVSFLGRIGTRIGLAALCAAWLFLDSSPILGATAPGGATAKPSGKPASRPAPARSIPRDPYVGAILVDVGAKRVLFEDRADVEGYPASVLKLMDLLIILERIEQGQLSFEDKVPVSAKAAATGGSQVWLAQGGSIYRGRNALCVDGEVGQ